MRLFGKNPVLERLRANPKTIRKIYLQKGVDLRDIVNAVREANLTFISLEKKDFQKMTADIHAQGVLAEVDEFVYMPFEKLLDIAYDTDRTILFLDSLTDPQNLGSIIRTVGCLGGFSIILPVNDTVGVNETVLRVSCGGENYVHIANVKSASNTLSAVKDKGFIIGASIVESGEFIYNTKIPDHLCLILGSEGKGVRPGVLKYADLQLSLPMSGANLSYNVSVASAMFCYEIVRQKKCSS